MRHVYRELNAEADRLATARVDRCRLLSPPPWPRYVRAYSDGGLKAGGGMGCTLHGSDSPADHPSHWRPLADASFSTAAGSSSTEAELAGVASVIKFVGTAAGMGAWSRTQETWDAGLLKAAARPRVWRLRPTGPARRT